MLGSVKVIFTSALSFCVWYTTTYFVIPGLRWLSATYFNYQLPTLSTIGDQLLSVVAAVATFIILSVVGIRGTHGAAAHA